MFSHDELFLRSLEYSSGVYEHQNNPLVSAETVRHSSTYIILYISLGHNIYAVHCYNI